MQLINTIEKLGHAMTLDFILVLPTILSPNFYEYIMSVTNKFTKRNTLISGQSTYSTEDWADALLERLDIID